MSRIKLTRRFLLIGLLGGAGLWAIRSPTSSTPQKKPLPCDDPNVRLERRDPEPPLVHVRWAIGRKDDLFILSIPMPFFKYPPRPCYSGFGDPKDPKNWEKFVDGLYLKVRLSDFSPWMYVSRKEEKKYRLDDLEIKIDSSFGYKDKSTIISERYDIYVKSQVSQRRLEPELEIAPGDFRLGFKPDTYGLKHYGVIGNMDHLEKLEVWRGVGYSDVYYIDDEFGNKQIYIEANADQFGIIREKDPNFDGDFTLYHHFYNKKIDAVVKLAYTRRQLANWRTIQERVETWLNALPITPNRRLYDG
jgi:hypothetical protein